MQNCPRQLAMQSCVLCSFVRCGSSKQIEKKQKKNSINIDQEYADDISVITTSINTINYKKNSLPTILEKRNLTINETKTEEYTIKEMETIAGRNADY